MLGLFVYWVGDGINKIRIIEGSLEKGAKKGDSKVKCKLIKKGALGAVSRTEMKCNNFKELPNIRHKTPPPKSLLSI